MLYQIKQQKISELRAKANELESILESKEKEKEGVEQLYNEILNRSESDEHLNATSYSGFNKTMESNAP